MSAAAVIGAALAGAGIALMALTALGLARLPDFFARVHAVSKSETLGIALVLIGLILFEGVSLVSLKLGLIAVFIAIANPVGAHVLTRAAVRTGTLPWRRPEDSPAGGAEERA